MPQKVEEIPIDKIEIGDRQRRDYGDIENLKLSIEMYGLLYPIIVEPQPGGLFSLRAGGRRLQAFNLLGRKKIDAFLVETLNEAEGKELELEENLQRKDLTYIERAKAIREIDKLKKEKYTSSAPILRLGRIWTQKDTAEELGISEAKVSEDIKIAEATELYPEIGDLKTKREILRYIRRMENGLIELAPSEVSSRILESFCFKRAESVLAEMPLNTINLALIDLREYADYESLLENKILPHFSKFGALFIFCDLISVPLVYKILGRAGMKYPEKPGIWFMRGSDDYIPLIYTSYNRTAPPLRFNTNQSIPAVKEPDHTREKPYQLYYNLIMSQTSSKDFILDLTAYNYECAKVCIDHNRNCLLACPDAGLFEMKKREILAKGEGEKK